MEVNFIGILCGAEHWLRDERVSGWGGGAEEWRGVGNRRGKRVLEKERESSLEFHYCKSKVRPDVWTTHRRWLSYCSSWLESSWRIVWLWGAVPVGCGVGGFGAPYVWSYGLHVCGVLWTRQRDNNIKNIYCTYTLRYYNICLSGIVFCSNGTRQYGGKNIMQTSFKWLQYTCIHWDWQSAVLRSAHTIYLCVLCGSENKEPLFPYTTLTDWIL